MNRLSLLVVILMLIAAPLTVYLLTRPQNTYDIRSKASEIDEPVINPVKTMLVIYDPILPKHDNMKLSQYYKGWNNPKTLNEKLILALNESSHGNAKYQIVETREQNMWLPHKGGKRYTEDEYLEAYAADKWTKGDADWNQFLAENDIVNKINSGVVDEIWLWAPPEGGYQESAMAGNGAYYVNGSPIPANTQGFVIMNYNYERELDLALHSYGHRVEAIMRHVYGGVWDSKIPKTPWDTFSRRSFDSPGQARCGDVHYPPNATTDYDYANKTSIQSACNDWNLYPKLPETANFLPVDCSAWGCTQGGYLKWWFAHMPNSLGSTEGIFNNWWAYILKPNLVSVITPTPSPSPLPSPDRDFSDLLYNPSFEANGNDDHLPKDWKIANMTSAGKLVKNTASDGRKSFRLGTSANNSARAEIVQSVNVWGKRDDVISLALDSKNDSQISLGEVGIEIILTNDNDSLAKVSAVLPKGKHGWQTATVSITAKKSYKKITAVIYNTSPDMSYYIDNIRLTASGEGIIP